ncbi:cysteine proteinase [Cantharellus anzutake]|uniref:cysteine proteinase n=1 Tax=Cantharellus anzutake TaxID=1750568 RepID=UPI001903EA15|nr:cysteine proteinase [Cantharellus anzutake]KAF8343945.1 cysteine proteinase [Cantharellus anzutake]
MEVDDPITIHDHEAFAAKNMPELGHDVEDFAHCTWRLTKWKSLEKRLTGPEFECGGHRWRILLFPAGNSNAPPNESVSIYLDYADPKSSNDWHACAQFSLVMSNIHDPSLYVVSHAHHRFVPEECDWGFTRFHDLRKLYISQEGHKRPVIEEDSADVSVFVRVLKDPTGVLWHNFANYDSKKETGYVGLKNQGATCYMNSLLQSLYCTHYFRKAVYQIPTESDVPHESVALALQRVFYHLQTSDLPVGTTELTRSFGWKSLDSFMQHDVQEFNRVLQDKLEIKMKETDAEGAINKLFVGKMKSYIKCVNVEFESARTEEFYDIQLNVKGMKNLQESFRDYVAVETLEGDNKYQAEGFGLQDAKKGVIFQSFPPVLHLQLKRFEYDIQRDAMVKINDRHEFPFEIDLGEFLDESADRTESYIYKLHGVLVHSGDLHGGHYFALIKPDRDARWLKFDDDRVTPVTDKEVLEENYGGEALNGVLPQVQQRNQARNAVKRFTNAYMLVYVRESAMDWVLSPFTEADTPPHLKQRLDEERAAQEAKKRERDEQHLFLTAKVITDETFRRHQGFDLASFDDRVWPPSELPTFRVLKTESYLQFKSRVAEHFHFQESQIRLWVLVNRQNKTVRPDTPIPENEHGLNIELVRNNMAARQADLKLYLDVVDDDYSANKSLDSNAVMIFLKHFSVNDQTLKGIGKVYVHRNSKVGDMVPTINEMMGWAGSTPVRLYEEIKPGMIELMKPKMTFAQSEIQDGDILCFQVEIPEREVHDLESQGLYPSPVQYYDFLQNRVLVHFKPRFEDQDKEEFNLVLSRKTNYDTMSTKVAEHLNHEPLKLRFTSSNPNGTPKSILKRSLNQMISDVMGPVNHNSSPSVVIFYERLEISIIELETKRSLKIIWTGINNKEEATFPFLLPKNNVVHDLIGHINRQVTLNPSGSNKIRVFDISRDGRRQRELTGTELLGTLSDTEFYAEEIPLDELESRDAEKIIDVFHFTKETSRTHGVPFRFVLRQSERFSDTKRRLQARMGVSDSTIAKYRFALVQTSHFKQPSYIADEDIVYDHKWLPDDALGLDHVDKSGRAGRTGVNERAIVIKG